MNRKLNHQELVDRQNLQQQKNSRLPVTIILNNIRSLHNVGAIFRTADAVGIEKLMLCGITGIPPDNKISKTALGAEATVPWEYHEKATDIIQKMKQAGYRVVLLEQTEKSIPYHQLEPKFPLCLILGNEITGVSDELLRLCDDCVEIEMSGLKNSLNVSVAFGVVAYHLRNIRCG